MSLVLYQGLDQKHKIGQHSRVHCRVSDQTTLFTNLLPFIYCTSQLIDCPLFMKQERVTAIYHSSTKATTHVVVQEKKNQSQTGRLCSLVQVAVVVHRPAVLRVALVVRLHRVVLVVKVLDGGLMLLLPAARDAVHHDVVDQFAQRDDARSCKSRSKSREEGSSRSAAAARGGHRVDRVMRDRHMVSLGEGGAEGR